MKAALASLPVVTDSAKIEIVAALARCSRRRGIMHVANVPLSDITRKGVRSGVISE